MPSSNAREACSSNALAGKLAVVTTPIVGVPSHLGAPHWLGDACARTEAPPGLAALSGSRAALKVLKALVPGSAISADNRFGHLYPDTVLQAVCAIDPGAILYACGAKAGSDLAGTLQYVAPGLECGVPRLEQLTTQACAVGNRARPALVMVLRRPALHALLSGAAGQLIGRLGPAVELPRGEGPVAPRSAARRPVAPRSAASGITCLRAGYRYSDSITVLGRPS